MPGNKAIKQWKYLMNALYNAVIALFFLFFKLVYNGNNGYGCVFVTVIFKLLYVFLWQDIINESTEKVYATF